MTHMGNLQGILADGGIYCFNRMKDRAYNDISNESVQAGRSLIAVGLTIRTLHDYVPLYFGWKTPMVACMCERNEQILFLRFSLSILEIGDVVFTDGNARTRGTAFFKYTSIEDLAVLDASAINSIRYSGDQEKKRKKQAELLIPDFLPLAQLYDIIVFSEEARARALAIANSYGRKLLVRSNSAFYFKTTDIGVR